MKRVYAHGLRHTQAVELRREGVDIEVISKQLGHRSIDVTARYLDHIASLEVVGTMRAREWSPSVAVAESRPRTMRFVRLS